MPRILSGPQSFNNVYIDNVVVSPSVALDNMIVYAAGAKFMLSGDGGNQSIPNMMRALLLARGVQHARGFPDDRL